MFSFITSLPASLSTREVDEKGLDHGNISIIGAVARAFGPFSMLWQVLYVTSTVVGNK